jgi:UDP-hydrolysing UDP-N-acetyl-D-glucosamine 2-epimerase
MIKKKICVVTGSRSEFGLMTNLLREINKSKKLKLFLLVTGMHLMSQFGNTFKEIQREGFKIHKKVRLSKSIFKKGYVERSIGIGVIQFSKILKKMKPDLVCIPCDRYEMLGPTISCYLANIPIAHFYGGEITKGSQDDITRNAITKMSNFHFVTHLNHRRRVIQMGENPKNVFLVGNMGLDNILLTSFFSKKILKRKLKFDFSRKNILITFHPITNDLFETEKQIAEVLKALANIKFVNFIFTKPNSDIGSDKIIEMIENFVKKNKRNAHLYSSLGSKLYYSILKNVDCIIGNSSSGLTEAPFLGIASINIGNRQEGRTQAGSVLNIPAKSQIIENKIRSVLNKKIKRKIRDKNYLKLGATKRVIKIIEKLNFSNSSKKSFYDLKQING